MTAFGLELPSQDIQMAAQGSQWDETVRRRPTNTRRTAGGGKRRKPFIAPTIEEYKYMG